MTFEEIPLGAKITYVAKGGLIKEGRVVRKKQSILTRLDRKRGLYLEGEHTSIMIEQRTQYSVGRVNLTKFDNVRLA